MRNRIVLTIAGIALMAIGCNLPGDKDSTTVQTVNWEVDDENYRRFSTNNVEKCETWSAWAITDSSQNPMTSAVETKIIQKSGAEDGHFGILFCWQGWDNFYVVRITISGLYSVFMYDAGAYTEIIPWTPSADLNTGSEVENNLKVTYSAGDETFTLYINSVDTVSFDSISDLDGGSSGYFVYISSEEDEDFPDTSVDVRFKELDPVYDPPE